MSRVIYLLGAGASFGTRNESAIGPYEKYQTGVPIVKELGEAIDDYLRTFYQYPLTLEHDYHDDIEYPKLYQELSWLRDICKNNITVDDYAKNLWSREQFTELTRLKRVLAMFFSLIQSTEKRDKRYDPLIGILSRQGGQMNPDASILSWNYDRQVEFALHRYDMDSVSDTHQLKNNNISCKNLTTNYLNKDKFNLVKLNGTATFQSSNGNILLEQRDINRSLFESQLSMKNPTLEVGLSFAWEEDPLFLESILPLLSNTEILVIIGYSLPDANYSVDQFLISKMNNLKSIIIQDLFAQKRKNSLKELLNNDQLSRYKRGYITIETRTDTSSFYIPKILKV